MLVCDDLSSDHLVESDTLGDDVDVTANGGPDRGALRAWPFVVLHACARW